MNGYLRTRRPDPEAAKYVDGVVQRLTHDCCPGFAFPSGSSGARYQVPQPASLVGRGVGFSGSQIDPLPDRVFDALCGASGDGRIDIAFPKGNERSCELATAAVHHP